MNHISRPLIALLLLVLGCNTGCNASPNLLTVSKNGIVARGKISGKTEQIDYLEIYPDKLFSDERQRLWIGFSSGKQVPLQALTKDLLKQIAIPSTRYYENPNKPDYLIDGYDFHLERGHITKIAIGIYDWSPARAPAFNNIGLRDGGSLRLPSSVDDFEKTFGKAKVDRSYVE